MICPLPFPLAFHGWLNDLRIIYSHRVQSQTDNRYGMFTRFTSLLMMAPLALWAVVSVLALPPVPAAHAGPGEAQGEARREMRAGNVRSLREIEQHVLPMMAGAQYLGPEYDPLAMAYRLKFVKDGRVVFVDVDARSGEILRQRR